MSMTPAATKKMPVWLTVIIPTNNCAEYIAEAIDSIVEQGDSGVEIVVVDDGSTDDTLERLETYSSLPNFTVIKMKNSGPGPARNAGLDVAAAEYVYFLDSDDMVALTFVSELRMIINDTDSPPDLICFGSEPFYQPDYTGGFSPDYRRKITGRFAGYGAAIAPLYYSGSLYPNVYLYVSKRTLWNMPGMRFKSIYHEDDEIVLSVLLNSRDTIISDLSLHHRRIRKGSIMNFTRFNGRMV